VSGTNCHATSRLHRPASFLQSSEEIFSVVSFPTFSSACEVTCVVMGHFNRFCYLHHPSSLFRVCAMYRHDMLCCQFKQLSVVECFCHFVRSVLENYHVSTAFTHTIRDPEVNIFRNLDKYSFSRHSFGAVNGAGMC